MPSCYNPFSGQLELKKGSVPNIAPDLVPTGTTQSIDWNTGNTQVLDLSSASDDVTVTMLNGINGRNYTLFVIQGSNALNVLFPGIYWQKSAGPPHISIQINAIDIITFVIRQDNFFGLDYKNFLTNIVPPIPFTPGALSNLKLWIDASNLASITKDIDNNVSQVIDLSPNTYTWTTVGESSSVVWNDVTIGGQPGFIFSGKSGLSEPGSNILGNGTDPFTIWIVFQVPSFPFNSFANLLAFNSTTVGAGKAPQLLLADPSQTGFYNLYWGAGASSPFKVARANSNFQTINTPYIATLTYDGSGTLIGTEFYSSNVLVNTVTGSDNGLTGVTNIIGNTFGLGLNSVNGTICEIVIQRDELSFVDRSNMQTYFFNKYGTIGP